jgi:hypothetical protein
MIQLRLIVVHEDVVRARYQTIATTLLKEKAVELFAGQDEEYVLHALEESDETIRYEGWKKTAPNCPLFHVEFTPTGSFTLSSWGEMSPFGEVTTP